MRKILLHSFTVMVILVGITMSGFSSLPKQVAVPQNGDVFIAPGNAIEIAVAFWTGFPGGDDLFTATQMAIDNYGPIKGFSMQRHEFDSGCTDPSTASSVAATIVANTQNVGLIGPLCSSATLNMAPGLETAGIVMITPSATGVVIDTAGPSVFNRVVAPDPSDDWLTRQGALDSAVQWESAFEAMNGHAPNIFAKFAYDAMTLLLTRIDQVSSLDGSNNLVINRAALRAAVRNTSGFPGVTGTIDLDIHGNRLRFDQDPVWTDPFDSTTLQTRWFWLDEDASHWSLAETPGSLRITTQDTIQNRLLQGEPLADYTVRTRMTFTPLANFNFAGILVYLDASNMLAFGRAYCSTPPPDCTGGDGIYFDSLDGGSYSHHFLDTPLDDTLYLQVVRAGNVYTGSVSADGTSWIEIGAHTIGFVPRGVGLFAQNNSPVPASEITADFDYFNLQTTSTAVYLPMVVY